MRTLLIFFALVSFGFSFGQGLSVEAFVQQSQIGLQKGYGVHLVNEQGWGLGTILQSTDGTPNEKDNDSNYLFWGLETRIPIHNCGRLRLALTPMAGFVNKNFFVALPEIQTEYQLTRMVALGIGAGIRVNEAAISFKISIQPFRQSL